MFIDNAWLDASQRSALKAELVEDLGWVLVARRSTKRLLRTIAKAKVVRFVDEPEVVDIPLVGLGYPWIWKRKPPRPCSSAVATTASLQ